MTRGNHSLPLGIRPGPGSLTATNYEDWHEEQPRRTKSCEACGKAFSVAVEVCPWCRIKREEGQWREESKALFTSRKAVVGKRKCEREECAEIIILYAGTPKRFCPTHTREHRRRREKERKRK